MIFYLLFFLLTAFPVFAQNSLDYFIGKAEENSPALNEYRNQEGSNRLQGKLNHAQNSAFQVSVTGNYLFTPYFNNHGDLITTDPSPRAVGYDVALYDGGLYSAQVNVEHNLFNGKLTGALNRQVQIQGENFQYQFSLEQHSLKKDVTAQYLNALQYSLETQLSQGIVDNLQQQLNLTGELVEKGYASTRDYLLLQIELKNQQMKFRDMKEQYKSNLLQLYSLCGIRDTSLVEINPVALEAASPMRTSNFMKKYELDSLAVVTEQTLFETKYQPQLQAFFTTGLNAIQLQNIQRKFGMSAGLNLSLALFDGNQRSLTRQQNRLTRQTISEYRRYSERNIALQRRNLQSQMQSMKKNIRSLAGQIQDYEDVLDISARQLQQGSISMIDYLTLLRNSIDLRRSKIEAETNYQLAVNNYNYWNW